jgi:hypothetical protein
MPAPLAQSNALAREHIRLDRFAGCAPEGDGDRLEQYFALQRGELRAVPIRPAARFNLMGELV